MNLFSIFSQCILHEFWVAVHTILKYGTFSVNTTSFMIWNQTWHFIKCLQKKQTYPQIVTACNRDFNICNLITLLCVLLAPPITYMSLQPEVILLAFGCFFNGLPMHGGVQTDISSPKSSSHFQCKIVSHSHGDDALAQRASRFRA